MAGTRLTEMSDSSHHSLNAHRFVHVEMILLLCRRHFLKSLQNIVRCGIGIGNYVWLVKYCTEKYIIRCSEEQNPGGKE